MSTLNQRTYAAYRQGLLQIKNRWRQGVRRVKSHFWQLFQAAFAAAVAYAIAVHLLGHPNPFIAATSAAVGVGVAADVRVRRSIELAVGVTLGVTFGEILVHLLGSGLWQVFVVMMFSFLIARLLDSGAVLAMQMGIQSIYVVVVPPIAGVGPFSRTEDAAIGGAMAILLAALIPRDPRKEPRRNASVLLLEVSEILDELADAARRGDRQAAERALHRGRDTQGLVDTWQKSVRTSQETARISPANRRHAAEVNRLARACEHTDRAIRIIRVIARRMLTATAKGTRREALADSIAQLAAGSRLLKQALLQGQSREPAQEALARAAAGLDPRVLTPDDLQGESLVLLLRPMAVDLLMAAGHAESTANASLPAV